MNTIRLIERFGDDNEEGAGTVGDVWTVLGNDTVNLAWATNRWSGEYSLEFDKANGAANTVFACAYRTVDLDLFDLGMWSFDKAFWQVYLSDLTNVAYTFARIGSSATNHIEWRCADSNLIAGWSVATSNVGDAYLAGTGWDPHAITYLAVGVAFDAETNTLADIKFDHLGFAPNDLTRP